MANPEQDTFFFEQQKLRSFGRRYRKSPDDLPQDLRFAHLNPRIAAYLVSKEKEKIAEEIGSDVGSKSLLPQINQTVSLIRSRLDSFLNNDEDAQRLVFEEAKLSAASILAQLAKILYLFEGSKPNIPRSLEFQLVSGWNELTADVHFVIREWQLPQSKEEYLRRVEQRQNADRSPDPETQSLLGGRSGSSVGSTRGDPDDLPKSTKDPTSLQDPSGKASRGRSKASNRNLGLADINEDREDFESGQRDTLSSVSAARGADGTVPVIVLPSKKESSRTERVSSAKGRNKDRRDLRPGSGQVGKIGKRTSTLRAPMDDVMALTESPMPEGIRTGGGSGREQPSYWAVIQFQLSSKACQDKGWVISPAMEEEAERETILEWATQRLRASIKLKKEQATLDKEANYDTPLQMRYYGDSRKDQQDKFKRQGLSRQAASLAKGEKPRIPSLEPRTDGKKLLMTTLPDGTTTVYYPSGRVAILTSKNMPGKDGYYTFVYENHPQRRMLGCFTPSGRGMCHHDNGAISFISTEQGGSLSEQDGSISKRWKWPSHGSKMSTPISLTVNCHIQLRCSSLTQMHLYFNCQKESTKLCVGVCPGVESVPNREDLGLLITSYQFSSQTAREFSKNYKSSLLKSQQKQKSKAQRNKAKSPVPAVDLIKILEYPESTENDPDADKDLYRLQRKLKNMIDGWMEHYRMAVGISSPDLRDIREAPTPRGRQVQSAKSSPGGGGIVIIERESTRLPPPGVTSRVPSAPAGAQSDRMERFLADAVKSTKPYTETKKPSGRPTSGTKNLSVLPQRDRMTQNQTVVQFSENHEEIVVDQVNIANNTLPATDSSSNLRSIRSKSAPHRLMQGAYFSGDGVIPPMVGLCPMALREGMLGEEKVNCHCSRHKIPYITDVEFDEFIQHQAPEQQLIIVAVISSLYPVSGHVEMLEEVHCDRNRNRTRPCVQSRQDPFRILLYDVAMAAQNSNHIQPLLLRRHNVLPGMFLMYEAGQLVFCDHILNGYGIGRKDLQKQMLQTRRAASLGQTLPQDFRFSPQKGRHGSRAAWGGEIGGAGVDRYGSVGLTMETDAMKRISHDSLSSEDSYDVPLERHIRGSSPIILYIKNSLANLATQLTVPRPAMSPDIVTVTAEIHLPVLKPSKTRKISVKSTGSVKR